MCASYLGDFNWLLVWSAERTEGKGSVISVFNWLTHSFAAGRSGGGLLKYQTLLWASSSILRGICLPPKSVSEGGTAVARVRYRIAALAPPHPSPLPLYFQIKGNLCYF